MLTMVCKTISDVHPLCRLNAYLSRAVIPLQALRRGSVQRRSYLAARAAVIQLQALARGSLARRRFLAARAAAVTLQAHWRSWRTRNQIKRERVRCEWMKSHFICITFCKRKLQDPLGGTYLVPLAWM